MELITLGLNTLSMYGSKNTSEKPKNSETLIAKAGMSNNITQEIIE